MSFRLSSLLKNGSISQEQRGLRQHFVRRARSRRGVTLVELVLSLGITSVLAAGLAAATMLAARSLPERKPGQSAFENTHRWLNDLQRDLDLAIAQLPSTSNQCVLLTGDQTGDQIPDRIVYELTGGNLQRTVNGETPIVYQRAHTLTFTEAQQSIDAVYGGPMTWQAETVVSALETPSVGADHTVSTTDWMGQVVTPTLPDNAVMWRMTGLALVTRPATIGSLGTLTLKAYETDENAEPTGTAFTSLATYPSTWLTGATYDPNGFDTTNAPSSPPLNNAYAWVSFAFPTPILRPPQDVLAITAENHGVVAKPAEVRLDTGNAWGALPGPTWSLDQTRSMLYRVYGEAAVPGTDITEARPHLNTLHTSITPDNVTNQQHALAPLGNIPQLERVWFADMSVSPLTSDLNQDGVADWSSNSSSAFGSSYLKNNLWQTTSKLETDPIDIDGETIIQARVRATSIDNTGLRLTVSFDANPTRTAFGVAQLTIKQTSASRQSLELSVWDGLAYETQIFRPDFGTDLIDLQVVLNPSQNAIALWANGQYLGTAGYNRQLLVLTKRGVNLDASGSSGEVDFLSVRVQPGGLQ